MCGKQKSVSGSNNDPDRSACGPQHRELFLGTDLFAGFSDDELDFISEHSELLCMGPGSCLYRNGEKADSLFIVVDGSIEIMADDHTLLAQLIRGDCFGELELFTRSAYNADAVGPESFCVIRFPRKGKTLEQVLDKKPLLASRILRSFLRVLARRTRKSNELVKENSPWIRELQRQVYGDKLTGLYNKAYLEEKLPAMLSVPLALIMLKPDNFKEINDRFGHEAGDAVLVRMAQELSRYAASSGLTVRYEGNEIALVFPGAERTKAIARAEEIRTLLEKLDLSDCTGSKELYLSVSLGLALYDEHADSAEDLIRITAPLPLAGRQQGGSRILLPELER